MLGKPKHKRRHSRTSIVDRRDIVWLIAEFEEQLEELLPIVGPHWRPNLDLHSGSIYGTAKPNHR